MRTVTFGGANSLDNFIARTNHEVDWLIWDKEVSAISKEFWKSIDTVLMGRKTYQAGNANGYPGVANYVFSRTLEQREHNQVTIVSKDAEGFVRHLKAQEGKGICVMGGGVFAKTLFEADLIDEIGLNIHPVLLSSGVPLFYEIKNQIDLELIECKPLRNGCVVLRYRVQR